jgi:hypothetical protein
VIATAVLFHNFWSFPLNGDAWNQNFWPVLKNIGWPAVSLRRARRKAFPVLSDMIEWHQKRTRYGIRVDSADWFAQGGCCGRAIDVDRCEGGGSGVTPRISTRSNQCAMV